MHTLIFSVFHGRLFFSFWKFFSLSKKPLQKHYAHRFTTSVASHGTINAGAKASSVAFPTSHTFMHGLPSSTRQRSTEYVPLLYHYCKSHMLRRMSGKLRIGKWVPTDVPRVSFYRHSFLSIKCIEQWKEPHSSVRMSLLVTHWKKGYFFSFLQESHFLLRWRPSLHLSFLFLKKNCLSI